MEGPNSRRKRLKSPAAASEGGTDRISELPEALIVDILSLLPTKDSIRTGALARKWKHLWTLVPHLYFYDSFEDLVDFSSFRPGDFAEYVNKTLILCSGSKVKSVGVKWCCDDLVDDSHYDSWTSFAVENEIDKFELENYYLWGNVEYYTLPELLTTNSSFKELRFRNCDFIHISGQISWNSLKKLTILDSDFINDSLEEIVAGSPALEILDLHLTRGINHFHLGNLVGLKKLSLTIKDWELDDDEVPFAEFEISAPSVQSLEVSGYFESCKLLDMTSLIEATLFGLKYGSWGQYPILTQEVLTSLLNVQTLTIGTWVIKGIALLPVNDRPSLSKCKCLTLDTHLWKEDPSAIATLLKNTPGIEALIVTMSGRYSKYKDTLSGHGNSYIDQCWSSQAIPSNYLTHLKTVKFDGFWAYRTFAFQFVKFLLKNVRGLQKVIIDLETKDIIHKIALTELFETSQKLLRFPRSSPDAELLIHL